MKFSLLIILVTVGSHCLGQGNDIFKGLQEVFIDTFQYTTEYGELNGYYVPYTNLEEGVIITYYKDSPNLPYCIHEFKGSNLDGNAYYFFKNGRIWIVCEYHNGQHLWRNAYYDNGKVFMRSFNIDSDSTKLVEVLDESGQSISEEEGFEIWFKQIKEN